MSCLGVQEEEQTQKTESFCISERSEDASAGDSSTTEGVAAEEAAEEGAAVTDAPAGNDNRPSTFAAFLLQNSNGLHLYDLCSVPGTNKKQEEEMKGHFMTFAHEMFHSLTSELDAVGRLPDRSRNAAINENYRRIHHYIKTSLPQSHKLQNIAIR